MVTKTASKLVKDTVQAALKLAGYQLTRSSQGSVYVPTPPNTYPIYTPSEEDGYQREFARFAEHTLTRPDRAWIMRQTAHQALRVAGDWVEAGVFRGGTSWYLAELLREAGDERPLHCFDSFEGMPADADKERDGHEPGDFNDTSLERVTALLSDFANVQIHPGFIPGTLAPVEERSFSLVHIDVDIYSAVRDCCAFFYPRTNPGGFLLFDDYGFEAYRDAAKRAVDEYFADKPESVFALRTGQALVVKLPA